MKNFFLFKFVVAHKILTLLVVIVLVGVGYWAVKRSSAGGGQVSYVTAIVVKGTVIKSITGTGQVSVSNQIDLKPKASGDVVTVGVVAGQAVRTGQLIVSLNSRDAQKAVRDAVANVQSAQLSLEKLQQPTDSLSILQAENTLARAQESKPNAEADLKKAYEDGFNNVANAFLDLPTVMSGLQSMFYGSSAELSTTGQWNIDFYADKAGKYNDQAIQYKADVYQKYQTARTSYDKNYNDYKAANRLSDTATVEALIVETYETTRDIAEAIKSANNLIQLYQDEFTKHSLTPATLSTTHLASLTSYTGTTNSLLLGLLGIKTTIQTSKDTIVNADRTIAENTASLAKLQAGTDPLDLKSAQLTLQQRQNALLDARETLADYVVRAPFNGTIATVDVKKSDPASSGTAVATLVTKQKIAEVSLNEVDVAKLAVGQKATLTFDAVEGLSVAGQVAEIDTLGTVSQGVVTYNVKIGFDTQDDRIKSGMSVSAAIITDVKQDVLTVPNSAVKTQGSDSYVEMFDQPLAASEGAQGAISPVPPSQQAVVVGLSNDTTTEVVSGLKEGDQVVVRTITTTTSQASQSQAPSLFGATGGGRGAGGAVGIPRGN